MFKVYYNILSKFIKSTYTFMCVNYFNIKTHSNVSLMDSKVPLPRGTNEQKVSCVYHFLINYYLLI